MESEVPKAEIPPQAPPPQTLSPNVVTVATPVPSKLEKFFSETTKYTVFEVVALYSIGFIIWKTYLGNFGVSSVNFLQTEYLSAAFCYCFVVAMVALPPAFIFERWRARKQPQSQSMSAWLMQSSLPLSCRHSRHLISSVRNPAIAPNNAWGCETEDRRNHLKPCEQALLRIHLLGRGVA